MTTTDNAKIAELPVHLVKVVDDHIRNIPYYTKLISGEVELGNEYGAFVQQLKRIDEITRITAAIEEAYNELEPVRRPFITLYYFSKERVKITAAADRVNIGRSTAQRWKSAFISDVCKKLGWI